jgi:hypothetical protein
MASRRGSVIADADVPTLPFDVEPDPETEAQRLFDYFVVIGTGFVLEDTPVETAARPEDLRFEARYDGRCVGDAAARLVPSFLLSCPSLSLTVPVSLCLSSSPHDFAVHVQTTTD